MNLEISPHYLTLEPNDSRQLMDLCGPFDAHLRQIEKRLGVVVRNRGNEFEIYGDKEIVCSVGDLLTHLYREVCGGTQMTAETVHLFLQESGVESISIQEDEPSDIIKTKRKNVRPRGLNQIIYVRAMRDHDISFGVGPAGTGKTFLAVACAVEAFEQERVARILLVRPAVEAGEKLGFLPGDLSQKIDPYLRPLYDALYELFGFERVEKLIVKGFIEIAPLAYMRGRTLNDAFVILDQVDEPETGVVTQNLLATIDEIKTQTLVIGDSRRGLKNWPHVIYKMNADELARFTDGKPKTAAIELAQKTGKPVFVSVAENGILCANPNGETTHSPALPVRGAIDIVGAGDAVTANLATALATDAELPEALELANRAASIVIHKLGTTGTASVSEIGVAGTFSPNSPMD